jgi:hypothetical protein
MTRARRMRGEHSMGSRFPAVRSTRSEGAMLSAPRPLASPSRRYGSNPRARAGRFRGDVELPFANRGLRIQVSALWAPLHVRSAALLLDVSAVQALLSPNIPEAVAAALIAAATNASNCRQFDSTLQAVRLEGPGPVTQQTSEGAGGWTVLTRHRCSRLLGANTGTRDHAYISRYRGPLPPSRTVHRGPITSVALQSMQFAGFRTSRSPSRSYTPAGHMCVYSSAT